MSPLLPERVAAVAARHPGATCFTVGEHAVSYGAFWRTATTIASRLESAGVAPGDRVALVFNNSPEAAAAAYGAWLAGAVAVPLNAQARARDLATWIEHCGAAAVMHGSDCPEADKALATLAAAPPRVSAAGPDEAEGSGGASTALERLRTCVRPDDLAALVYTSGTTGHPKAVMLSHRNFAANVASIVEYLGLTRDDCCVSVLPFYYSYGASVLHTHLAVGGRLVLEQNVVYPHRVAEAIDRERATGFAGVPSTYALLLQRVQLDRYAFENLRYLTQAGGAMSPAVTRRLREAVPRARLFVMFGQTEATARLTYLPPDRLDAKLGSVGIPIPGVAIEIRGPEGEAVEVGTAGEIWARGENVMLGYWRDAEATRGVLRDGWLRTGDLGYLDADGYLYVVGRRSDMIKVGAHRIHPLEIEEAIAELAGVAEVAVVGVDDELLGQVVRAFVVREAGATIDAMAVKAHCRARLASYKIPRDVDMVSALPKTATGKIRRAELAQTAQRGTG